MMWFAPRTPTAAAVDDAGLVRRIAAGDRAALEGAYRREAAPVYRYLVALGASDGGAADATQEAFVVLATRASTFDAGRGSLGAWLAGVARHALLMQWRQQAVAGRADDMARGEGRIGDDDMADDLAAHAASPETLLLRRQSTESVWAAIRALPFGAREALVLVDLQERSYAEAAAIAGVGIDTLRTRLHRARRRLARALAGDEGNEP